MIPKILHYCWFGPHTLPKIAIRCINSWKKKCPDLQIMLWNEQNFDVHKHPYTSCFYTGRVYAPVTDYVRATALYKYGGIYLDTDVLLKNDISHICDSDADVIFQLAPEGDLATYMCASAPHSDFIENWIICMNAAITADTIHVDKNFIDTYNGMDILNRMVLQDYDTFNSTDEMCSYYNLQLLPHTFISNKIYSIGEYGVHLNLNDWGKR
ncbi:MAG: hypothetical protein J6F30_12040 [Cellulosilyticum sp.]|nr:hypothetical protein [Cellulosilyticum sp.]